MSAGGRDATFSLAAEIVARSWAVKRIESTVGGVATAAGSSRSLAIMRKLIAEVRHMPAGERTVCLLLFSAAAISGHVLLASMLPASARPTVALTALLLAAGLAAILRRRR